jgi:hypothetical protein
MGFTWTKPISAAGQITADAINEIRTNVDWIDNHHDAASGYYCATYYASHLSTNYGSNLTSQYSAQCASNYDYCSNMSYNGAVDSSYFGADACGAI